MANTHIMPSTAAEQQAIHGDLLPPAILASTLSIPGSSSMTLPAFMTYGYVRNGTPTRLCYVNQPAAAVTLAGSNGAYWLALHHDTHTDVVGWSRQEGTHYLWQAAATQPADPPGGLVMASVTVASGGITVVDLSLNYPYTKVAYGGSNGTLAFDKNLTWNAGVLTVRNGVDARHFIVGDHAGDTVVAFHSTLLAAGGTNRWFLYGGGTAPSYLGGPLTVAGATVLSTTLHVFGPIGQGAAPVPGYALTTNAPSQFAANVTVGMVGTPATTTLDVNGTVRSRGAFTGDSTAYIGSTLTVNGATGLAGAADSRFSLRSYGTSFFDGLVGLAMIPAYRLDVNGESRFSGGIGIGTNPGGGWGIACTWSILTLGNLQANGTLWIGGATTLNSMLYVQGGTTLNGHTIMGTAGTTGNLTCAATLGTEYIQTNREVGLMRAPVAGWALSVGGAIQSNNAIANKLGAGPWGESSSRHLKRNIAPIPDALGLLLEQRGRRYEWEEPERAALMPGVQHGFVYDEVTIPQWRDSPPGGAEVLTLRGFEALTVEALRAIVMRLEALERN